MRHVPLKEPGNVFIMLNLTHFPIYNIIFLIFRGLVDDLTIQITALDNIGVGYVGNSYATLKFMKL